MKSRYRLSTTMVPMLSIAAMTWCSIAHAWDNPGHMAVAGVAFDELTAKEQTRLIAIIQQHPNVARLLRGFGTSKPSGRQLVMSAATWPDLIKDDKKHPEDPKNPFKDIGGEEKGPIKTVTDDHMVHRTWHFIDNFFSIDGTVPPKAPTSNSVNAVTVTDVLVKQLKSGESDKQKAFDMAWLFHLAGDMHQPLQAIAGVTKTLPKGDKGGNDVSIIGVTNGTSELHAFWDDILGKTAPADKTTFQPHLEKDVVTADAIVNSVKGVPLPAHPDTVTPSDWVDESEAMAKTDGYKPLTLVPFPTTRNGKPVVIEKAKLDASYKATATKDAQQRIKVAGHRLALLLKPILDKAP